MSEDTNKPIPPEEREEGADEAKERGTPATVINVAELAASAKADIKRVEAAIPREQEIEKMRDKLGGIDWEDEFGEEMEDSPGESRFVIDNITTSIEDADLDNHDPNEVLQLWIADRVDYMEPDMHPNGIIPATTLKVTVNKDNQFDLHLSGKELDERDKEKFTQMVRRHLDEISEGTPASAEYLDSLTMINEYLEYMAKYPDDDPEVEALFAKIIELKQKRAKEVVTRHRQLEDEDKRLENEYWSQIKTRLTNLASKFTGNEAELREKLRKFADGERIQLYPYPGTDSAGEDLNGYDHRPKVDVTFLNDTMGISFGRPGNMTFVKKQGNRWIMYPVDNRTYDEHQELIGEPPKPPIAKRNQRDNDMPGTVYA